MERKTTIHDIARELNTTAATVSRALNNHPSISAATKEMVRETAARLNYRQNKLASSLRSGRTHTIGVIIPSAEISFFGSVVHGIERVARSKGYRVLLFQSNEDPSCEAEGIEALLQSKVDGIIASVAKETTRYQHYLEVKERNIPLVLFDRVDDSLQVPSVVIDDYKGAYMATMHLIEQGYTRIAHISGQQHIKIFNDRLRGYADALRVRGLPVEDDLIAYGKVSVDSGRDCTDKLLSSAVPPDAIVAVEDFTALGAMQSIKRIGLHIPREIGLIGFANEAFSSYITPSLSTIDQQTIKMGEEAALLFLDLRKKKENGQTNAEKIVLDPVLLIRESSQRINV
ncbi:LacI family transcriptional regulator [Anseongella ginsenosidimutans]|uniref:LacI family transcriptional regulator n=1 Tax=Anseongella ginsenosidimutans TaxID=496056 RepID=A0A4R3KWR2_9SPHI|nr:LacI family DNA-binding transcriptional regulator [Anseongella ginsenosidimutans]QEC51253.1 LacI family transcriptional regulator [Anseongella ginsenosidimutans]TCS90065.1 LacI family transcriptional regulator [Anseongella ginsenosidimutans]